MTANIKEKIAATLLIFSCAFGVSILYFVLVREIKIGAGTGVPIYSTVIFADSPKEFISILIVITLAIAALLTARVFILNSSNSE